MTLGDILDAACDRDPASIAVVCGDAKVTREELKRTSSALASCLIEGGLTPGCRVAIHWSNSIEVVTLYFACFKAGLIAVPINIRLKAPEVAWILGHSQPSICFSQPQFNPLITQATAEALINVPLHSSLPTLSSGLIDLPPRDANEPCAIFYTSGTTARPKGVTHSHASLAGTARLAGTLFPAPGAITMSLTQVSHMAAMTLLLPTLLGSHTAVLLPAFDPGAALDLIERHRVDIVVGLPVLLTMMAEEQSQRPRDVSSLRACLVGGDSAPLTLHEKYRDLFSVPLYEAIGMSESVPISWNVEGDVRPGSCGKPRLGVETRIVPLQGNSSGVGELIARSPATFIHYWRDPEATAETLRDGWIHTGDLVRQDADGYLWFAGRLKQIIIRGGSNIAPQEVEEALYQHPSVLEAGVIGIPDPPWGQVVGAGVVLRENHSASEEELRDFTRVRLADYKVPERVSFLPTLPKGPTGKVDRRTLAEMLPGRQGK
jgi:long-chain acyl-CoA synthetase